MSASTASSTFGNATLISSGKASPAGDTPDAVAELDALATRLETSFGQGRVVWRVWGLGKTVVLFHGAFGSWTHWLKTIPVLAQQYCVVVPDIPGFGDSDVPPEPCSVDSLARILSDGLKQILTADERIAFVGFSFGGQMAGGCARNLRDRARQVVLVSSSNVGIPRSKPPSGTGWRHLATRAERDAAHRSNLAAIMIHDPAKVDGLAVWVQRNNVERARLRTMPPKENTPLRKVLAEAGCEVSYVCGDEDARCKPYVDRIHDVLGEITPDPKFVVLHGQGHWLPYEAPEMFSSALLAILDSQPSPLFEGHNRVVMS